MNNYYSAAMEGITYDAIETTVIEYLSKLNNIEEMLQIVKDELSSNNRIMEFNESVKGWDSICFIGFKFPLAKKTLIIDSITYRELTDTHYWANEFHDTVNKILITGSRNTRVK